MKRTLDTIASMRCTLEIYRYEQLRDDNGKWMGGGDP